MRIIFALPLLVVAGCSVQHDNGQTSVTLNGQPAEDAASAVGNAADEAASDIGNAVSGTGQAIENNVDNLHVDVDVGRDRNRNSQ